MKQAFNSTRPVAVTLLPEIFDWDHAAQFNGLRMTSHEYETILTSLRQTIATHCPTAVKAAPCDLLQEMIANNMMSDLPVLKAACQEILEACLAAQYGAPESLHKLTTRMQKRIDYVERHYGENKGARDVPLHIFASMLDDEKAYRRVKAAEKIDAVRKKKGKDEKPVLQPL